MKKTNKKDIGIIKIYWCGLDMIGDGAPEGLKLHPILQDWNKTYYELNNRGGKITGKIEILKGSIKKLCKTSQIYFKEKHKPDETIKVNKKKFLEAVKKFSKRYNGKRYYILNFSKNCIGFKNYVLEKSEIKEN